MAKRAFEQMMAGLDDALAFAQGDTTRGQLHRPVDVRAVRQAMKKTQAEFAATYHLPIGTLRDWEQGRRQPDAPARILLGMIKADPEAVERLIERAS